MRRHVLIYGLIGGILVTALKWSEYRFLIVEHSLAIYGGLIAATFAVLGICLGLKLKRIHPPVPLPAQANPDHAQPNNPGLTPRELEILSLIAQGLSNREIAAQLYVSENTVKTHASRVFEKLGAKRRTQAVQLGKEFGLLR